MPVILLLTFEQPGKEKPPFLSPKQNSNDLNTAKILYYIYVVLSYFEQTCDFVNRVTEHCTVGLPYSVL